ncbi:hypothetical protein ROE7235_02079 [Roseibaca ekhonensis]|jgi:uncharacterized protein (DUF2062 family)|uniref:DUF2062 domain-containing protein n=1 Tax=Roseinatronobacter ekhonensis TaxID=254356 RepID=A0A3B0M9I8_9RHOB|nr:DUF2062 domain-containing protein [Roseibaca ekhonensis]SUZ32323.1 hypothetical protein ROE7235_02079 [Roseibaca ekhonensis]
MAYPDGGWQRAGSYVWHRLRRLPDSPERIAKGIAAGVMVSFLPLFGLHFLSAAALAWVLRGNILAALLGTFFGNPFTFPLILVSAMETGSLILGQGHMATPGRVIHGFKSAWSEISANVEAVFTPASASWDQSHAFFSEVFLPYMLGGSIVGSGVAVGAYFVSLPIIRAYRARRQRKLQKRFERARQAAQQTSRGN